MRNNATDIESPISSSAEAADIWEQRNQTFSRLYQLPNELIMSILRRLFHDQLRQWHDYNQPLPMQLAQRMHGFMFCRRVRAVAQRMPEIWTFIPLYSGEERLGRWVDLCLQRTAYYPLNLYVSLSSHGDRATIDRAIMLSGRTCDLQLVVQVSDTDATAPTSPTIIVQKILSHQKWPLLTSMSLIFHESVHVFHISSELLGEASDALVTLEIQGSVFINVEANHRPFSRLEHLTIRTLGVSSFTHWLKWLPKLPVLQSIDITFRDRHVSQDPSPLGSFQANLPHLRSVKLSGTAHQLLFFLSSLPDPLEKLSLSISTFTHPLPGIKEAEKALAKHIVATWQRHTERERDPHDYKLTLDHPELGSSSSYAFNPIASASDHDDRYRIDVKSNVARKETVRCLAQAANTLEILPRVTAIPASAMISALQSPTSIHTLKLHAWSTLWGTAVKIQSLEKILRALREKTCPLKTLIVDAPANPELDQLERRWVEEGLIHEMIKG
jgi:hypothetical protein